MKFKAGDHVCLNAAGLKIESHYFNINASTIGKVFDGSFINDCVKVSFNDSFNEVYASHFRIEHLIKVNIKVNEINHPHTNVFK